MWQASYNITDYAKMLYCNNKTMSVSCLPATYAPTHPTELNVTNNNYSDNGKDIVNKMLFQFACGDEDKLELLKYILGASVTDKPLPYVIAIYGIGDNGKTAFMRMIQIVAGDYYRSLPFGIFDEPDQYTNVLSVINHDNTYIAIVNEPSYEYRNVNIAPISNINKMIMTSNIPVVTTTPDKVKHITFDAVFVDAHRVDESTHHYLADHDVDMQLQRVEIKRALLDLATEYAQKFHQRGCTLPFQSVLPVS